MVRHVTAIHLTVREFFVSEQAEDFRVVDDAAHADISHLSLGYICGRCGGLPQQLHETDNSQSTPHRLQTDYIPFVSYLLPIALVSLHKGTGASLECVLLADSDQD